MLIEILQPTRTKNAPAQEKKSTDDTEFNSHSHIHTILGYELSELLSEFYHNELFPKKYLGNTILQTDHLNIFDHTSYPKTDSDFPRTYRDVHKL